TVGKRRSRLHHLLKRGLAEKFSCEEGCSELAQVCCGRYEGPVARFDCPIQIINQLITPQSVRLSTRSAIWDDRIGIAVVHNGCESKGTEDTRLQEIPK